jgi:prefoldin alpha subunit
MDPLGFASKLSSDDMNFDQIAIALEQYEQRADEIRQTLEQFYTIHENYTKLYKKLQNFEDKSRIPTLIPFGNHAFLPGQITNTHTLTVYLGEGYYREMTTKETILLVEKRLTGLQSEIEVNRRELASFGHHISHCYSILGKPMYTPTLSDKMKEKMTGKRVRNDDDDDDGGGNGSNTKSKVTITQQGVNEDGDGVFEIIEHLDDDEDPLEFKLHKPNFEQGRILNSNLNTKSTFHNNPQDDEEIDPNAPMSDVFYKSLTKTLDAFESERIQDYTNEELNELEEIEKRLMGDMYVPPTKSTKNVKNNEQKPISKQSLFQLDTSETPHIVDDVFIPRPPGDDSGKKNMTSSGFFQELNLSTSPPAPQILSKSLLISDDAGDEIVDLMNKKTNNNGLIQVVDDHVQNPDYENYFEYLNKHRGDAEAITPPKKVEKAIEAKPTPIETKNDKKNDAKKPSAKKEVLEPMIKDTIQVRQRPQRGPATTTTTTTTTTTATTTTTQNKNPPPTQPTTSKKATVLQSGAIETEEVEEGASVAYQRYLMAIGSQESSNYFSQFLNYAYEDEDEDGGLFEDIDDIEGYGDEDWDEDGFDEGLDDFLKMKDIYSDFDSNEKSQPKQKSVRFDESKNNSLKFDEEEDQTVSEKKYQDMLWSHLQSVVDEDEQNKIKSQSGNNDNGQHSALPAQDRPVYASFSLGTTIDGGHALVTKSTDSTLYTSETLTGKKGQTGPAQPEEQKSGKTEPSPQNTAPQKKVSRFKQMRMDVNGGQ